jgi:hypothetical protein
MTIDQTFAVSLVLGAFGMLTMWMSQGHDRIQRKFAPVVGIVAQVFWGYYAWLLGPAAGGLWILIAMYSLVYLRGIWVQWSCAS